MKQQISRKGKLIVFEGIDGSGKSTQVNLLAEALKNKGISVWTTCEPTKVRSYGCAVRSAASAGQRLPQVQEIAYLLTDRLEHVTFDIIPMLEKGRWVITDRYYMSMVAYQGDKVSPRKLAMMNEAFCPKPDVWFLLDMPVEEALKRAKGRGATDAFEQADYLQGVRDRFLYELSDYHKIDALRDKDDIAAEVLAAAMKLKNHPVWYPVTAPLPSPSGGAPILVPRSTEFDHTVTCSTPCSQGDEEAIWNMAQDSVQSKKVSEAGDRGGNCEHLKLQLGTKGLAPACARHNTYGLDPAAGPCGDFLRKS